MSAGTHYLLRPAESADAAALAALDSLVNASPWSEQQFSSACADKQGLERVLLLNRGARLQGFVVYSQVLDEASILNIAVEPGSQGHGLGERLLGAALARVRDCGASRCFLELRVSNEAARGLYRKFGFTPDGLRKGYYPTASGREDAVLMSLVLNEQE